MNNTTKIIVGLILFVSGLIITEDFSAIKGTVPMMGGIVYCTLGLADYLK